MIMYYDLDYLYYFLGLLVSGGTMSPVKADDIFIEAQRTGVMPEFSFTPFSELDSEFEFDC